MIKSKRTRPLWSGCILFSTPRRSPIFSISAPWCACSISRLSCSKGSCTSPATFFVITSGRDTPSSYPSRRMVSMSTAKCNSPRPETMNLSGESPSATRRATLYWSSRSSRSRMLRLVINLPSRPAKGDVLTWKVIEIVGSSTLSAGNASAASGSQIVSEIDKPSIPDTLTMSPANASSCSTR